MSKPQFGKEPDLRCVGNWNSWGVQRALHCNECGKELRQIRKETLDETDAALLEWARNEGLSTHNGTIECKVCFNTEQFLHNRDQHLTRQPQNLAS